MKHANTRQRMTNNNNKKENTGEELYKLLAFVHFTVVHSVCLVIL